MYTSSLLSYLVLQGTKKAMHLLAGKAASSHLEVHRFICPLRARVACACNHALPTSRSLLYLQTNGGFYLGPFFCYQCAS